ncbi:MAG: SurA N-terminal domain-containing protein [Candidatus Omnitrophota bacterium]|nr:MAG: SurA N-terminal domain-containing protein [Candidatus Omnitrophota bacterium]
MFGKIRERHLKRVLWTLVIIIIPSFILWGGLSYMKGRQHQVLAQLGKKKITVSDYKDYLEMARVHQLLLEGGSRRPIKGEDLQNKAWEFALLLWKGKKEKIEVSDDEVLTVIKKMFFPDSSFNKEWYFRFLQRSLRIGTRQFEEYMRNYLMIDKLYGKYVRVSVSEEELKEYYRRDTQKIKITYIMLGFEDFEDKVSIKEGEAEEFYRKNLMLFREDAKVKIKYIVISQDNEEKDQIIEALGAVSSLDELAKQFSLNLNETPFLGPQDPIEGIGWESKVNVAAFKLELGQLSPPMEIKDGFVLFQKTDQRDAFIPPFKEVAEIVKEKLIQAKMRQRATKECQKLLAKIKEDKIQDLKVFAKRQDLDYKDTQFFGYSDYIEGLGLDEKVSDILFSLKERQIYDQPILMPKGAYIAQLKSSTAFDEKDFDQKREKYLATLTSQTIFIARLKLLTQIAQEAQLKIFPLTQQ